MGVCSCLLIQHGPVRRRRARGASGPLAVGDHKTTERQARLAQQVAQLVSLLSQLELEQEIPPHLYRLVAVVLSWAYWFKGMRPGDEKADLPPSG